MAVGVSEGYKKELELVGVGYRVSNQAKPDGVFFRLYAQHLPSTSERSVRNKDRT